VVGEARRAASADAVVSVDALHLAPDLAAAGREVLRILRPSHRLVLTSWQPRTPEDARLPSRLRIDWTTALRSVGFVDVQVESRAEWHELFTRVYRVALDLGSPGEDVAPTGLQDEARLPPCGPPGALPEARRRCLAREPRAAERALERP
jgi:SAM-dependent methyltransferase